MNEGTSTRISYSTISNGHQIPNLSQAGCPTVCMAGSSDAAIGWRIPYSSTWILQSVTWSASFDSIRRFPWSFADTGHYASDVAANAGVKYNQRPALYRKHLTS